MSELIPINAEVLKWARESSGLSLDDVVLKVNRKTVSSETIKDWESGLSSPTYPQLEKLAYDIYKRPLAVFFFPAPPKEKTPKQSFRTLPEYEIEHIPSKIKFLLRKAQAYQFNLYELYDGVNPANRKIMNDLSFDLSTSISDMGSKVRSYLSVSLERQESFKNPENAFKEWRNILEELGIFVFKDAFKEEDFSGFCLYDEKFPVIYVNNSKPFTRQIFTLFHELAHILFKTGGVDTNLGNYINYFDKENEQIEIICNKFSGEFLVPSDSFISKTKDIRISDDKISLLADTYNVSKEVILRKFLDQGRVSQEYYDTQVDSWKNSVISKNPKNGGGNYYFTQRAYLGTKYIEKAFSQYYQDRITTERLADYLGVKVKNLSGIEPLLY